jgi:hypothetical protein
MRPWAGLAGEALRRDCRHLVFPRARCDKLAANARFNRAVQQESIKVQSIKVGRCQRQTRKVTMPQTPPQRVLPCVARGSEAQLPANQAFATVRKPPAYPRAAGGFSGRPSCRIYLAGGPSRRVLVLEFEPASGGLLQHSRREAQRSSRTIDPEIPTLQAAISYAERHGLHSRVVAPRQQIAVYRNKRASATLPKSWIARLSRTARHDGRHDGRHGETYHG